MSLCQIPVPYRNEIHVSTWYCGTNQAFPFLLRAQMNRSAVVEGNSAAGTELKNLMALPASQKRGITIRGMSE